MLEEPQRRRLSVSFFARCPPLGGPVMLKSTVFLAATNGEKTSSQTQPRNAAWSTSAVNATATTEPLTVTTSPGKGSGLRDGSAPETVETFINYVVPNIGSYGVSSDLLNICSLTRHFVNWAEELLGDPNANLLLRGIAQGFKLVQNVDSVAKAECCNYSSTLQPVNHYWTRFSNKNWIWADFQKLPINLIELTR